MGRGREDSDYRVYAADFETTVFEGQEYTEVWASGLAELGSDECVVFHSIEETWDALVELAQECNLRIYYHNLKFDGHFWLDYLYRHGYENALDIVQDPDDPEQVAEVHWSKWADVPVFGLNVAISDAGQWYYVKVKVPGGKYIEFRDSLKLIPMPLERAAKDFDTPHKKLRMDYEGERFAGCEITPDEMEYIKNDVLALKECLEIIYDRGHNRLTIGSCCMNEFRKGYGFRDYAQDFPNLTAIPLSSDYGSENADEYIRKSYRGGWCYCHPRTKYHNKKKTPGLTADVNSLYPSQMHSESGNRYPIGEPKFFKGKISDKIAADPRFYWFQRLRMRFRLKPDHLPFIQIKNTWRFTGTEYLTTSEGRDGKDQILEFTLTMTDYKLLLDHYDVYDLEFLDGCYFWAKSGIFDDYIDVYKKQKIEAENKADRTIAKLFQNNLYGKFAANDSSSFKVPDVYSLGDSLTFDYYEEHNKRPGYIAIGSAITSFSRNFTIRAAQANYHVFAYADTDSIHIYETDESKVQGITIHDKNYCCWKIESHWEKGWFVRQKTYAEFYKGKDERVAGWHLTCAGLPTKCKKLFLESIGQATFDDYEIKHLDEDERRFMVKGLESGRTIADFDIGISIPGKLVPRVIPGGVVLTKTDFTMR